MLTEHELDSLQRIILYSFNRYIIDVAGWSNAIKNMTASEFLSNQDVQDRLKQDIFIRDNFENEDIITYIHLSLKDLVSIFKQFDKDYYKRAKFVKDVNDWYNIVDLYTTEMAKHGDLPGV